jgi:hypothetical protein
MLPFYSYNIGHEKKFLKPRNHQVFNVRIRLLDDESMPAYGKACRIVLCGKETNGA